MVEVPFQRSERVQPDTRSIARIAHMEVRWRVIPKIHRDDAEESADLRHPKDPAGAVVSGMRLRYINHVARFAREKPRVL